MQRIVTLIFLLAGLMAFTPAGRASDLPPEASFVPDLLWSQPFSLKRFHPSFAANTFEDFVRPDLSSFSPYNSTSYWSNENPLQLEFRRIIFSLSRYAPDPYAGKLTRASDTYKQKQGLIQSLPSTLQNTPFQDSMEAIGKIIEPSFNIKIEF